MDCSPDIADKGKHGHATQQAQQSPVVNFVSKPRQEYDPYGQEAVLEDDGLGAVLAHQPLHNCAKNMRTKLWLGHSPQVSLPCSLLTCLPCPRQLRVDSFFCLFQVFRHPSELDCPCVPRYISYALIHLLSSHSSFIFVLPSPLLLKVLPKQCLSEERPAQGMSHGLTCAKTRNTWSVLML